MWNYSPALKTQPVCGFALEAFYTVVNRMSEAENASKEKLEESSQLGAKAEGDDQILSRATDMSNQDAEDSTAHKCNSNNEENDQRRMLIIAGEYQDSLE